MGAITPSFVFDLESRMQMLVENEYMRLASSDFLWWNKVTKVMPLATKRLVLTWILNTAQISDQGDGGNFRFEDMTVLEREIGSKSAGAGFKIARQEFEDLDGNGINFASQWASDMGAQQGYWPQQQVSSLILAGESGLAYDGLPFFSASHLLNPNKSSVGTYSNLFTGLRIDDGVSIEAAVQNLAVAYARIAAIKMPNGAQPRLLRPAGILAPPRLMQRAVQVTDAKYIAMQAAALGAGSADLAGSVTRMGFGTPTQVDEFGLTGSDDQTYYIVAEQLTSSQQGAIIYAEREPFSIRYYTGRGGGNGVDAILDREDALEWHTSGRNDTYYGHPYYLFKCKPS